MADQPRDGRHEGAAGAAPQRASVVGRGSPDLDLGMRSVGPLQSGSYLQTSAGPRSRRQRLAARCAFIGSCVGESKPRLKAGGSIVITPGPVDAENGGRDQPEQPARKPTVGVQLLIGSPACSHGAFAYAPGARSSSVEPGHAGCLHRCPAAGRGLRTGADLACPDRAEIELKRPVGRRRRVATPCVGTAGESAPIQPPADPARSTCARTEAALWSDLRKKWRQYVNKARKGGVRVVDATRRSSAGVLFDLPRDPARGPGS